MYWLRQNKKKLLFSLILIIATLPATFALFHKGFIVTDDAEWMIIRLSAFYPTLADGQFPVRFLGRLNNEYGYPAATFLYPGFMYIGSIIHLLKVGFVDTVKIILGISMVSGFVFSYFWLRGFFDKRGAFIGSLFYLYTPYHLFDLYKRGSVGEVLALTIVPFILWQIERKSTLLSAFGIGFLILSHNSLAVLFAGFIAAYFVLNIIINKDKLLLVYRYTSILLLGFGLAAFFWIPAVFELQYTKFSQTKISNTFEYFASIELLGYSTLLVLSVTGLLFVFKKVTIKKHRLTFGFLTIGIISVFFATKLSGSLWNVLPAGFIQFPFRILSVTLICIAFLAAFTVSNLKGLYKKIFILASLSILSVSTYQYISTINYFDKGEGFYVTNSDTTTVHDEYMPNWVKEKPLQRSEKKVEIIEGNGQIHDLVYNNKKTSFIAEIKHHNAVIQVNTIYWPGWELYRNNEPIPFSYNNLQGVIRTNLTPGIWPIELRFEETPLRLFSDIISLASLIVLVIISKTNVLKRKKKT